MLQAIVFIHYFFIISWEPFVKAELIFQQLLVSLIFLCFCYLFCKNSSKILPGRKKWLTISKIIGVITAISSIIIAII